MASTEPAGPGEQPDSTAPRLVVVLARDGGESRVCRVDAPDRVLRIWALLNNASEELRQVDLPAGAVEQLERQLGAFTAELERSVSPDLGRELHELFPPREASAATARELRIEYAGLLGWAGSLVIGILSQVQAAAARAAQPVLASGPRGQGYSPAAPGEPVAAHRFRGASSGSGPVHHGRAEPVHAGIRRPCSRRAGPGWFGHSAGPPKGAADDGRSRLVPSRSRSRFAVRHPAEPVTPGHLGRQRGGKHAG
jgi:hypothetical protein